MRRVWQAAVLASGLAGLAGLAGLNGAAAAAEPVRIVAAENFYGDVARQIAGPAATVTSILSNPDQDPHMFEASASVARELAGATIVIGNGADYDPWLGKLLGASAAANRVVITVADLVGRKAGDNPHLWYDPPTMPALATALAAALATADPAHKAEYDARLARFLATLKPLDARIAALHEKLAGTPVTATEPVAGYLATALGLEMHNERFQLAVMNDTEPSASDVAAFETDLKEHRVKLMIYNSQASDAQAKRLVAIARRAHVPVIGVTETEPAGTTYQGWMLGEIDAVGRALAKPGS